MTTIDIKEVRRVDTINDLVEELRVAMDRNPGLNARAVLDLAVTFTHQESSCHNKTNEEMVYFLRRYNTFRDRDKISCIAKDFVYEG